MNRSGIKQRYRASDWDRKSRPAAFAWVLAYRTEVSHAANRKRPRRSSRGVSLRLAGTCRDRGFRNRSSQHYEFAGFSTERPVRGSARVLGQCRLCDSDCPSTNYPSGVSRVIMRRLTVPFPPAVSEPFEFAALRKLSDHPACRRIRNRHLITHDRTSFVFSCSDRSCTQSTFRVTATALA